MKKLRSVAYATTGLSLLAVNSVTTYAVTTGNTFKANSGEQTLYDSGTSIVTAISNILTYVFGLLYFIAVLYGVWGGFNILTAGGDEEKVKKGRTIIINAIIGLVVIFLVGAVINLVISALNGQ